MKLLLSLFVVSTLFGCSTSNPIQDRGTYKVDVSFPAREQDERITHLIMHYTVSNDTNSLRTLTRGPVSAHYLIPIYPEYRHKKPVVLQLVPESQRAAHAGVSQWDGVNNINYSSIGIEIVNAGFTEENHEIQWYPYSSRQIDALVKLSQDIIARYHIKPENIIGHSDIAPTRKSDPGPLFPWKELAADGIGAWPDDSTVLKYLGSRHPEDPVPVTTLQEALATYGYEIAATGLFDKETRQVISAFQMHFRPDNISGQPDAQTEAIALALVEKYRSSDVRR